MCGRAPPWRPAARRSSDPLVQSPYRISARAGVAWSSDGVSICSIDWMHAHVSVGRGHPDAVGAVALVSGADATSAPDEVSHWVDTHGYGNG